MRTTIEDYNEGLVLATDCVRRQFPWFVIANPRAKRPEVELVVNNT